MKRAFILIVFVIVASIACKKSKILTPECDGSTPTYNSFVKSLVDANCTSSNCHPNFNSYQGISGIISNGDFNRHVLKTQDMPKNKNLSQDQLNKLQCWVNNGYPEN